MDMQRFPRPAAVLLLAGILTAGCGDGPARLRVQDEKIGPFALATRTQRQAWPQAGPSGAIIETANYRLLTTASRPLTLQYLPGFLEACRRNYAVLTGLEPRQEDEPMLVYMMGTREEWASLTRRITGDQAELYLSIWAGGYAYDKVCVYWDMGGTGTWSVAAHEGLHQLLAHRMAHQLPLWLEEGLCTLAEGHSLDLQTGSVTFTPANNPTRLTSLQQAAAGGDWIPLTELLSMDAGDAVSHGPRRSGSYYAQLWALMLMLRSDPQHRGDLDRLLSDAREARLHEALDIPLPAYEGLRRTGRNYTRQVGRPLFEHYFSSDLPAFEARYRQFAHELAGFR